MTLSDRRLLIELGAALIIKLILITLIKIHYFSPDPERTEPVPKRFFPENPPLPTITHPQPYEPQREHKER
ncbi:hypothetical protein PVT68_05105 [Microbulbifer bruguierae]|uniref:Uncharacterized protein n=1 Tax=Microbulbifer bruguierae TaxID=3029061 RepID=A0ABY8NJA2_9GAMM|nr:hypothetical protein [Microbulbifer bruguierae]WGL17673.1 hypothetical protein PVT68_05105 [Microbulbifer bruguierae]